MRFTLNKSTLKIIPGDITRQETEAIVNAANPRLAGGGGVDGAIHRAGGPKIMAECKKIGSCLTGQAVITSGGNLKAKYVIHTVGPAYHGSENDEKLLASAYRESLKLAAQHKIKSLAFPSISTGALGYPVAEAARIALSTIVEYLKEHDDIISVILVAHSEKDYKVYRQTLKRLI